MRSLTDEAKEIVREFMADGKVATRKMVAEQVEKNISRPNEYRVNILNGVIKVLTENHELDVIERGKYQLGKGMAKKTYEELAVMYLMNCKENMGSLCSIEGTDTSEDKKQFIMKVTDTVIEIDKLLVKFNGGVKPAAPEKKAGKAEEKPVEKAVEEPVKEEKKEPEKKAEAVKEVKKEEVKPVEKKAAPKAEKKEPAKTEKKEPAKEVKKEEAKPVEKAVAPKVEKKAEPAKKEEEVVKKEVDKEVKAEKAEPEKAKALPAVVKKEEAPKTEQKLVEKKEMPAK